MKTTSFLVAGLVGSASAFSAEQVDRRSLLKKSLSSAAALVVGGNLINADPANAAYSQTYLTEPTDEFKANEEKAMAFKRAQLAQKKAMTDVLTRLTTVSSKEEELVNE